MRVGWIRFLLYAVALFAEEEGGGGGGMREL